ncbi:MMPL family transporter [Undibacterium sp. Ji49W]|uniref:MMPL family transporter n=1 Tax=Undibacterium sp. Ji49W TaxID=3413040 RepID=UPI003BF0007A
MDKVLKNRRSLATVLAIAWALVVCLLLAHNAYLWLGKRITPDTDILALLPVQERDPVLQQSFAHMVDTAQQRVVVLIGAPDWEQAKRAAQAYNAVIATRTDLLTSTTINDQTQSDWLAAFQKNSLGLLTAQQEQQLRTQPAQFWTDTALVKMYGAFSGPKLGSFQDDPFGLFTGWVQERAQETPVRPRDGMLFVADAENQYVLLPMSLKPAAFSLTAQEAVLPLLTRAADAARLATPATPGLQIISAGVVLHAAAAGQQANAEVSTIGVGSLAGIILLMWFSFRSLKPILLILMSIGIGFLGAMSVCWLLFGGIHLLTLVFGASLIGVAQDYGIYFLCNRLNADAELDSHQLLKRLLPGLGLTLLAAVIGYLGLGLTPFPGLRHMAAFSALGLIFAWLTVVCWFPHLVRGGSLKSGKLVAWYSAALWHWPRLTMKRYGIGLLVGFSLLVLFACSRLGANDDIRLLQTPPKQLVADQIRLGKLLDAPTPVQYFLVRGASTEMVLQREEILKRKLEAMIEKHTISGYQALSNWVPSAQTQAARRQLIEEKLLADGGPLSQLAIKVDEEASWAAGIRTHLLRPSEGMSVDSFLKTAAGEPWRHLWLGRIGNEYASIVALRGLNYANGGLASLQHTADGLDGVQWVDKVSEISSVLGRYRVYMGWVVCAAYVLVFALLWPRYRRHAWRVLAPTMVASLTTLALFGLTGQSLQLFHVLALMLLLGVGVDYGIFMQEHADRRNATPWLAVGLSAANTILSFGLLGLSRTPALQAFGLTMLIGTSLVWLIVPCFTSSESHHAPPVQS